MSRDRVNLEKIGIQLYTRVRFHSLFVQWIVERNASRIAFIEVERQGLQKTHGHANRTRQKEMWERRAGRNRRVSGVSLDFRLDGSAKRKIDIGNRHPIAVRSVAEEATRVSRPGVVPPRGETRSRATTRTAAKPRAERRETDAGFLAINITDCGWMHREESFSAFHPAVVRSPLCRRSPQQLIGHNGEHRYTDDASLFKAYPGFCNSNTTTGERRLR